MHILSRILRFASYLQLQNHSNEGRFLFGSLEALQALQSIEQRLESYQRFDFFAATELEIANFEEALSGIQTELNALRDQYSEEDSDEAFLVKLYIDDYQALLDSFRLRIEDHKLSQVPDESILKVEPEKKPKKVEVPKSDFLSSPKPTITPSVQAATLPDQVVDDLANYATTLARMGAYPTNMGVLYDKARNRTVTDSMRDDHIPVVDNLSLDTRQALINLQHQALPHRSIRAGSNDTIPLNAKMRVRNVAEYQASRDIEREEELARVAITQIQEDLEPDIAHKTIMSNIYGSTYKKNVEADSDLSSSSWSYQPENVVFSLTGPDLFRHTKRFIDGYCPRENVYTFETDSGVFGRELITNTYLQDTAEEYSIPTENVQFGDFLDNALKLSVEGVSPTFIDYDGVASWNSGYEAFINLLCQEPIYRNLERVDIFIYAQRTSAFFKTVEKNGDSEAVDELVAEYASNDLPLLYTQQDAKVTDISKMLVYIPYRVNKIFEENNVPRIAQLKFRAPYTARGGKSYMGVVTMDILSTTDGYQRQEIEEANKRIPLTLDRNKYLKSQAYQEHLRRIFANAEVNRRILTKIRRKANLR